MNKEKIASKLVKMAKSITSSSIEVTIPIVVELEDVIVPPAFEGENGEATVVIDEKEETNIVWNWNRAGTSFVWRVAGRKGKMFSLLEDSYLVHLMPKLLKKAHDKYAE